MLQINKVWNNSLNSTKSGKSTKHNCGGELDEQHKVHDFWRGACERTEVMSEVVFHYRLLIELVGCQ
jgi:hypothetical protein